MAQKLRTILSELATDLNAINLDDRKSFRYLHSKFNSKLEYFLRLEARSREIINDVSVWRTLDCVKLIDVATNCCGYIDRCNTLKRSEIKIPEAFNTNYGQLITVLTITGSKRFKLIRREEYGDYINREYIGNVRVCFLEEQYLYFPNTTIEAVKVNLIPKNPIEVDKLNCTASQCSSILDSMVTYPDYLISLAKREVLNELLNSKRIPEDEKGDDNTNLKN